MSDPKSRICVVRRGGKESSRNISGLAYCGVDLTSLMVWYIITDKNVLIVSSRRARHHTHLGSCHRAKTAVWSCIPTNDVLAPAALCGQQLRRRPRNITSQAEKSRSSSPVDASSGLRPCSLLSESIACRNSSPPLQPRLPRLFTAQTLDHRQRTHAHPTPPRHQNTFARPALGPALCVGMRRHTPTPAGTATAGLGTPDVSQHDN